MGHNPKYRQWTVESWRGFAPTVTDMHRYEWATYAMCQRCGLEIDVNLPLLIQAKGRDYSLWGRTTPCRRRFCGGRMWFFTHPHRAEGWFMMEAAKRSAIAPDAV